nr:putative ribonuclease H-like domain-containing protein [Tanacetum cinerariifolium]
MTSQKALLESEDREGEHWKSRSKRKKSSREEDDLSQPWKKKCIKDPIEIHNIKQRDGKSREDFMKRYKLEIRDVKGAPECMRIFGFVHRITKPKLIKHLHDKILKTVDEMMRVTTSFLRGKWQLQIMNGRSRFHHGNSKRGYLNQALKNNGIVNIGCSRHMTVKKAYLANYQEIHDGGFVAFGSSRGKAPQSHLTPQQNRVTERKNRTLIEAARTMLADSLLPVTFWAEAVNTACYVLNRALVTKTHNKTPYELLNDRSARLDFMRHFGYPVTIFNTLDPLGKFKGFRMGSLAAETTWGLNDSIEAEKALVIKTHNKTPYELLNDRSARLDFMRHFGCPVTTLNTLDPLGKFKGKVDEGFLVGYSVTSKAFRVFNAKN